MDARHKTMEPALQSDYFFLPRQNIHEGETDEAYANRLNHLVNIQINLNPDNEIAYAEDLVQLSKKLPRQFALHILFSITRNSPFKQQRARDIIIRGIDEEDMARSPLTNGEKSYEFVKNYHKAHPEEVDYLMRNPGRLLYWLENAPPLEIKLLFSHYFKTNKELHESARVYADHMRNLAIEEIESGKPGKATLCSSLMMRGPLKEEAQPHLQAAIKNIDANEPNKFERMLKSAKVKQNANAIQIRNASGCFINTVRLNLINADFNKINLDGALMNRATLLQATFVDASLRGAELQQSELNDTDFTNAHLQGANMYEVQLINSTLIHADLRGVILTGANLTGANLYGAVWNNATLHKTTLDNVIFFSRSLFKFPDAVDAEFTRLSKMLSGHKYFANLHQAILADFLAHMQSPEIAEETRMRTLEAAYYHPLFNQHHSFSMFDSFCNSVATILPTSAAGFFWPPKDDTQLNQPRETKAQEAIRELLAQYKKCIISATDMRPLPPRVAPVTSVFK